MLQTLKQINSQLIKIGPQKLTQIDSPQNDSLHQYFLRLKSKLQTLINEKQSLVEVDVNRTSPKQSQWQNEIRSLKLKLQKSNILQEEYLKAYIAEKKLNQLLIIQLENKNIKQNVIITERMSEYRDSIQNSQKVIQLEMDKIQQIKIKVVSLYYQTKHLFQSCFYCKKALKQSVKQIQEIINKIIQPQLQQKIINDLSTNCSLLSQKGLEHSKNDNRQSLSCNSLHVLQKSKKQIEIFQLVHEIGSNLPLGGSETVMFCPENEKQCIQCLKQILSFSKKYEYQRQQLKQQKQQYEQNIVQILKHIINTFEIPKNYIFQLVNQFDSLSHLRNLLHKFYFEKKIREFQARESVWTFGQKISSNREFSS